jgi:hypothetical protein
VPQGKQRREATLIGLALHCSTLPKQVRVHFRLGLAKGRVGGAFAYLFLVVAAARTAHDVYGLEIVMTAVGIGGIVRERDPIEGIDAKERRIVTVTSSATGMIPLFGQLMPPALKGRHGSRRVGSSLLAEQRLSQ